MDSPATTSGQLTASPPPLPYRNTPPPPPDRRRDRLRSFVKTSGVFLRQEISKYYATQDTSISTSPPGHRAIQPSPTSISEAAERPNVPRQRTMSMNDLNRNGDGDAVKPQCLLFPTYASRSRTDDNRTQWKIRLTGWTFAKPGSGRIERWIHAAGRTLGGVSANSEEDAHFARLLNQFRCQTMRNVELQLYVAGILPADQALSLPTPPDSPPNDDCNDNNDSNKDDTKHDPFHFHQLKQRAQEALNTFAINSGLTGRFEKLLMLDPSQEEQTQMAAARRILRLEAALNSGLDVSPHDGFVDLIEDIGISVISDIDDTIKETGILDGRDAILTNTFFRKSREIPGMAEVYRMWASQGAHIHYVSNSPWQVYPALSDFFKDKHFPAGSMHLRSVSTGELIRKKPSLHKIDAISQILQDFPQRKFILVGDSGERDPEIYREIYERYPDQIIKIFIHDITSDRARRADIQESEKPDSYYNSLRKLLAREPSARRSSTSSNFMEAFGEIDVPDDQQQMDDPAVPLKTKLERFEERMQHVSKGTREGVFTVFRLAFQLRTDPVVWQEFALLSADDRNAHSNKPQ
ncbi:hypothetical protein BCR43DRAFT_464425 [Syncephalastrum racemosum]|uniref:Phosphatidate phosphatase APP1 catalytic domain-containing protein n=1 Tax=Syncephalastrum racemosum TaxID=13706 RepID=A0A1X2H097_SYNRA|nr:hypothetical protein BCR43DRAFT_464425 [Syncephalastrum racemosum]